MDDNINIPKNYFDVVYSIYAIGWTTDLDKTIKNTGFSSGYYAYFKAKLFLCQS